MVYIIKILIHSMYNKCGNCSISIQILEARWKPFEHLLFWNPSKQGNEMLFSRNHKMTSTKGMANYNTSNDTKILTSRIFTTTDSNFTSQIWKSKKPCTQHMELTELIRFHRKHFENCRSACEIGWLRLRKAINERKIQTIYHLGEGRWSGIGGEDKKLFSVSLFS